MANERISQLPSVTNSDVGASSVLPVVDGITKKIALSQLDLRWAPISLVTTVSNLNTKVLANQPMTTGGDMIYGGASGVPTRLGAGIAGYLLQANGAGNAPSYINPVQAGPASQAISASAIDWSTGLSFSKTLSAGTTFTFSNQISGQTIIVRLTNTASNYSVTWPAVKWSGGVAPTMSPGVVSDIYTFFYDGTSFFGSYVQNMS